MTWRAAMEKSARHIDTFVLSHYIHMAIQHRLHAPTHRICANDNFSPAARLSSGALLSGQLQFRFYARSLNNLECFFSQNACPVNFLCRHTNPNATAAAIGRRALSWNGGAVQSKQSLLVVQQRCAWNCFVQHRQL